MNRRDFLKFLGGAAAAAAVAPNALAEAFEGPCGVTGAAGLQGPIGVPGPVGPPGNFAGGFIVLEPGMSVQDAINALPSEGGKVYIPSGRWIVGESIEIPDGVTLVAQGNHTISDCHIKGHVRDAGDAPILMLLDEDDQVLIANNVFEWDGGLDTLFSVPIGEHLERIKRSIFDLYLRFEKLVI